MNRQVEILHIEDDDIDQTLFQRVIKKLVFEDKTFQITSTTSISKGIEYIRDKWFDIIFCDFNLPDGTALNLLQELSDDDPPVVILTGKGDIKKATGCLKSGAFDFIQKDEINVSTIDKLLINIEKHCNEKRKTKELEESLARNYANTNAILNNTSASIWSLDMDGKLVIFNDDAKKSFSIYFDTELEIGKKALDCIPQRQKDHLIRIRKAAIESGKQASVVFDYEYKGQKNYAETTCSPIYLHNQLNGVTFFVTNVTQRELVNQKIRQSERNFRAVFKGSNLPIMVESLNDNRIVDLNQSMADLHNYTIDEMIGMSIFDTIPPHHLEKSKINYESFLNGQMDDLESFIYTSEFESIPIHLSIAKITYHGEPCNLLFMIDISERKEQEEKLIMEKNIAEKTNEFKSQFLANMSHEIRTPMNAMLGFTELLEETHLDEDQKQYVSIVKESGKNLLVIVNDILDLTKIQSGKLTLRKESFSIVELLKGCITLNKLNAKNKGININLDLVNDLPLCSLGDSTRVGQIINNLLSNAIKFTEEGKVLLRAKKIQEIENTDVLEINVIDTGIGIPNNQLQTIFEDFSQIESDLQKKHTGTGLGLPIVKQLSELMGGEVSVTSTNNGTMFKVIIPFEKSEKTELSNVSSELIVSGIKVLMCEDNHMNILLAKKVFESLEMDLTVCLNGSEGVKKTRELNPDIIFMDIQMPIMDGKEATKRIREFSNVPIVAMTAYVMEEERDACLKIGMNDFMTKPFKKSTLVKTLNKFARKNAESSDKTSLLMSEKYSSHLVELADGDEAFIEEMLKIYLEVANDSLAKFEAAFKTNNVEKMSQIAHKMRSSFTLLNFEELNRLALLIEDKTSTPKETSRFTQLLKASINEVASK